MPFWLSKGKDSKKQSPKARQKLTESFLQEHPLVVALPGPFSGSFCALPNVVPMVSDLLLSDLGRTTDQNSRTFVWPLEDTPSGSLLKSSSSSSNSATEGGTEFVAASLGACTAREVDDWNIWSAVQVAANRAVWAGIAHFSPLAEIWGLEGTRCVALMDGHLPIRWVPDLVDPWGVNFQQGTCVGGDGVFQSIGLSSTLAKTVRDDHVTQMALSYPGYGLEKHKGYGTQAHFAELAKRNHTDYHRMQ
jgi:ribonuclease HII